MSEFEFILIMYSIVVAFSLSEVLGGWGKMIRHRKSIRFYWVHLAVMFLVAMLLVQF